MATFYTGNSGRSTGPHLDFRVWSHETGGYVDPTNFRGLVSSNGQGLDQFPQTSPYGENRGSYIHQGIDYGTEMGTPITVQGGRYLTTFDDAGGGGITSQYEITKDGKKYDILLMHGNDNNSVLSEGAVTDGISLMSDSPSEVTPTVPNPDRVEAVERTKAYKDMNKSELNTEYDSLRKSDPVKAASEGLAMHRAYFNK